MTTNVMVRDLDLDDPRATDARRLEVVVDGLPLFGGCQLLWTPQLSVLSIVMGPHIEEQRTWMGWSCTEFAAGRSEHTQNLWGLEDGPALLSWIEVGGRMSTETISFLNQLA